MKLGLTIFLTDQTIDPVELAVEAENRGYSSLWLPEHTHIPASRATPFPGGGELPIEYIRAVDPTVTLAMCAQATTTLVVGAGIALAAQHEPVAYAKTWATLDHLSNGRTRFGVGYGWNVEEMATHGVEYGTRRAQVREHVLAMQALWHEDEASFEGEYVSFEPTWSWPKPVQQPRIPTYVGGSAGPKLFEAISDFADGWLPIGGAGIRSALPQLHEAWTDAGREGEPDVIPFGTLPNAGKLESYRELGCSEVVLRLPAAGRDDVMRELDSFDEFVTRNDHA